MEDIKDIKYFSLKKVNKFIKENENNPKLAKELTKLILGNDPLISMRSSWTLQHLSHKKPKAIYPQIPDLIKFLNQQGQHTGAIRNVIGTLRDIDIPEKYCGEIFDISLRLAKNATLPHAPRVFAIYTATNICKKYPELKAEVELIISELKSFPQSPSMSACIRTVSKILLKL